MKRLSLESPQMERKLDRKEHPLFNLWVRSGMIVKIIAALGMTIGLAYYL